MKRRIQTLAKVAEVREIEEEEKVAEVRKARMALEEEQHRLFQTESAIDRVMLRLYEKQSGGEIDIGELGILFEYRQSLDRVRDHQLALVEVAQMDLDAKMEVLLEAHRERKVIETYRDKLKKRYAHELDLEEQKQMDVLFISRRAWAQ